MRGGQDIFSAGCVLAEMFNDGTELFDLAKVSASPPLPCGGRTRVCVRALCVRLIAPGLKLLCLKTFKCSRLRPMHAFCRIMSAGVLVVFVSRSIACRSLTAMHVAHLAP